MKKWFTLVEMLLVTVIASLILTVAIGLYQTMIQTKINVAARQSLIKNSYYFLERLNQSIKNYTIDYEEYFNRKMVGCDSSPGWGFSWNVGSNGFCDRWTHYGNSFLTEVDWKLYYCTSDPTSPGTEEPNPIVYGVSTSPWNWCALGTHLYNFPGGISSLVGYPQPYGEYRQQFIDYRWDADGLSGIVFDDDDVDLGTSLEAIGDPQNIAELYLISQDGKKRLFLRNRLVASGDWDNSGIIGDSRSEKLYTLEILRLKGFDAWEDHSLGTVEDGAYDGQIDTWACDGGEGFVCNGTNVGGGYTSYNLPSDNIDWWVEFFGRDITITWFKMEIYPLKNPAYAWAETDVQINPYVKIRFQANLYGEAWHKKINPSLLDKYQLDLQTTFNIRENY